MNDVADSLARVAAELVRAHGCHAVILYGSYARGDATPESDVDVAGVREASGVVRDARLFEGAYLDGFVYGEADLDALGSGDLLKLAGGRVLVDRGGVGARVVARARALEIAGPQPLAADQEGMLRAWIDKTLRRARRGDAEGNLRRAWLLVEMLETYFVLRGRWYRGPKEALIWLRANEPVTCDAFEAALVPGAPIDDIALVARRVLDTR